MEFQTDIGHKFAKLSICQRLKEKAKIIKMKNCNTSDIKRHLEISHNNIFKQTYGVSQNFKAMDQLVQLTK